MKLVRKFRYAGPAMLLSLLLAAPAFAQFEVSPDHFDSPQTKTTKKPVQKARTRQTGADASKHSAAGKSSTTAAMAATSGTGSKRSRHAAQPNASATDAGSGSKIKNRKARPAQHLSAKATPIARE